MDSLTSRKAAPITEGAEWTKENRARYDRNRLRYPSDLTDAEWAMSSRSSPAKRGGNRRHVEEREVVNGLMYVLSTGCQWRAVPKDLRHVRRFTLLDRWTGRHARSHPRRALREVSRSRRSRGEPDRRDHRQPSLDQLGIEGVKSAEKGILCIDPAAYDAGKEINGEKPHILVDTQGLLITR